MRTNILFWLTFALIVLEVNAVLDSQGTSKTITKLISQINTDPSANESISQIDVGNSNKNNNGNNNGKSQQSQHTGNYEDKIQLAMNGQQRPHLASKISSKANSLGSGTTVLNVAKRRFMRRGGKTTPAQQSDLITSTLSGKLVVIDPLRQKTSDPDQKSNNAPGQQQDAVGSLLGKQAIKMGTKQSEGSPVLVITPAGDAVGTVNPPQGLQGPVGFSSPQPKEKSEA